MFSLLRRTAAGEAARVAETWRRSPIEVCVACAVCDCVGVVWALDSVFVCFMPVLFLVFLVGIAGWPSLFDWLVFLGFNVFVFVRKFDPGSGRTAACLTHASRTLKTWLFVGLDEWRTGE